MARTIDASKESHMRSPFCWISGLLAAALYAPLLTPTSFSPALQAAEQRVADPKELPRFPPIAASNALGTFQIRKGFHLELVAAEPLVTDPIAFAFDADGRLFVVEMN